ncbi:hypothetical protein A1O3_05675 [Capronia epimyces CBS 606.96]|uniref:RRM domain-containing protein n=1 Tax=Capronia epimyces CBS 606.96 TaxID=1182542 RepID=W9Y5U5_9EURO|nr:uncharacterized protein A1O3_05675 [Capronia epimyces CBS 606.96]EXJ85000.1 hypothetical protein A1O3_05675 [Capronia epimyces CBS 606.96]
MSVLDVNTTDDERKSRKRDADTAEIEIDIDAPEPPSKKALRKAKRAKTSIKNDSVLKTDATRPSANLPNETRENTKRSGFGIWIGNLAFSTTKDDLVKFFTQNSKNIIHEDQITRIHLPQGQPKFGKPANKGFAYVDVSDENTLQTALEFSEGLLGGRRVLIKNAKDFEGRPEQKKGSEGRQTLPPSKRIFVGNLGFDTTVEELEEHFGICGPVLHTHMATFEDTGKCKGFAWIDFEQLSSAESAMRGWVEPRRTGDGLPTNNRFSRQRIWLHTLKGRKLRMEFAEDKATRYQKRYGKQAKLANSGQGPDTEAEEPIQEVAADATATPVLQDPDKGKRKRAGGRYGEETVQKLTGAIVESKGQRIVFEE